MSISREFVGTPTSTVGTSVTHQPAKARLEPRLGRGPAPTPRQLLAKCLSPSSTPKKAWVPCSEWSGGKDRPPPPVRRLKFELEAPSHPCLPTVRPQPILSTPARQETLALSQDPPQPPAVLIRTHLEITGLT